MLISMPLIAVAVLRLNLSSFDKKAARRQWRFRRGDISNEYRRECPVFLMEYGYAIKTAGFL